MPSTGGSWGSGSWGYGSWGGGGGGTLSLVGITAVRENVFRVEFSVPVYWTGILDPNDASPTTKWSITAVAGTVGMDGSPVRPLSVAEVYLPGLEDGVSREDFGRFIDVVCDRPMTPFPAQYEIGMTDIYAEDLLSNITADSYRLPAVFKRIEPPQIDFPVRSRDIANPQTRSAMDESLADPNNILNLGTIVVDDTGAYAFDDSLVNLRKRVIRRLVTIKGAFAHLPGYGVGIPAYGKKLGVSAVVADIAAQAEVQIALEPDVAKVKVRPVLDQNVPGLVRFQVLVRPRDGQTQRFDVPFNS